MIYNGWTKRALWINLSNKTSWVDSISDKIRKDYLGGRGFAIKTLFDNVGPNVKALDPDNLLIFAVGPTAGTPFPGRMSLMTKSPQTGRFTDGNGGGYFSAKMHFAGYDMLIISGESPKPVVLVIDDDHVTFEDASNLWGKTTYETEKDLAYRLGSSYQFKYIGPAGENLVNISIIMGNRYSAIGRTAGAVMGKKRLKAIAIRGSNEFQPVDKEAFKKIVEIVGTTEQEAYDYQKYEAGFSRSTRGDCLDTKEIVARNIESLYKSITNPKMLEILEGKIQKTIPDYLLKIK